MAVNIVQITAGSGKNGATVFGLSDTNKMYTWNTHSKSWIPFAIGNTFDDVE